MADAQPSGLIKFLIDELRKLSGEKRSGTLYVTTMNSGLVQVGLDQGEVVFFVFQNKPWSEALIELQEQDLRAGVSRFVEGRARGPRVAMPPVAELLKQLEASKPSYSQPGTQGSSRALTTQVKTVLEQELTEFMGPIANVICQETWSAVTDLEAALAALTRELPDPAQAPRFRQNVLRRLQ